MMEKKPLKAQFIISFILILAFSFAATIATYFLGFVLYGKIEYKNMYPANYYEKKVPEIEEYIRKSGERILGREGQAALEKNIPAEGISYQVMDSSGRRIYGTDEELIVDGQNQLYRKINTTFSLKRKYVRLVPVIDSQGKIAGAVSLSYSLAPAYRSLTDKIWISVIFFAVIFSPFFYVILFTWVFAKIIAKNIAKPLNLLIEASVKIGEKNLDFAIDYDAPNELGRLCKAFNEMKSELEKSLVLQWRMEQQRREMLEALAHDLKTPLSIIQGYAEALAEGNQHSSDKLRRYLSVIKENAGKVSTLVHKIQYASELEFSDFKLEPECVDVKAFILQKEESYRLLSKKKNIKFYTNISDTRPSEAPCLIDREKLERILDNIVMNSIRYTPDSGRINMDVTIEDDRLYFRICDSGKGFSPRDLAHIFDRFYRGDEARSSEGGHMGLGLYIARKLVEAHGGAIKAFNLPKGGACIAFDIAICR